MTVTRKSARLSKSNTPNKSVIFNETESDQNVTSVSLGEASNNVEDANQNAAISLNELSRDNLEKIEDASIRRTFKSEESKADIEYTEKEHDKTYESNKLDHEDTSESIDVSQEKITCINKENINFKQKVIHNINNLEYEAGKNDKNLSNISQSIKENEVEICLEIADDDVLSDLEDDGISNTNIHFVKQKIQNNIEPKSTSGININIANTRVSSMNFVSSSGNINNTEATSGSSNNKKSISGSNVKVESKRKIIWDLENDEDEMNLDSKRYDKFESAKDNSKCKVSRFSTPKNDKKFDLQPLKGEKHKNYPENNNRKQLRIGYDQYATPVQRLKAPDLLHQGPQVISQLVQHSTPSVRTASLFPVPQAPLLWHHRPITQLPLVTRQQLPFNPNMLPNPVMQPLDTSQQLPCNPNIPPNPIMHQPFNINIPPNPIMQQPFNINIPPNPIMQQRFNPNMPPIPIIQQSYNHIIPSHPLIQQPISSNTQIPQAFNSNLPQSIQNQTSFTVDSQGSLPSSNVNQARAVLSQGQSFNHLEIIPKSINNSHSPFHNQASDLIALQEQSLTKEGGPGAFRISSPLSYNTATNEEMEKYIQIPHLHPNYVEQYQLFIFLDPSHRANNAYTKQKWDDFWRNYITSKYIGSTSSGLDKTLTKDTRKGNISSNIDEILTNATRKGNISSNIDEILTNDTGKGNISSNVDEILTNDTGKGNIFSNVNETLTNDTGKGNISSNSGELSTQESEIFNCLTLLNSFSKNMYFLGNDLNNLILQSLSFVPEDEKILEFLGSDSNIKILHSAGMSIMNAPNIPERFQSLYDNVYESIVDLISKIEERDSIFDFPDINKIAMATRGKDQSFITKIIDASLRCHGYTEPSEDLINKIFLEVCSNHFSMSQLDN